MNQFTSARNIAHVLLQKYKRNEITNELITNEVASLSLMSDFTDLDKDELITQLEADFEIHSKEAMELVAEDVKPWLNELLRDYVLQIRSGQTHLLTMQPYQSMQHTKQRE